jgi:hypothetical protein
VEAGVQEDVEQSAKWKERGGELVTLPADETRKMRDILNSVGPEVTKSDPAVKAFYDKLIAAAQKY